MISSVAVVSSVLAAAVIAAVAAPAANAGPPVAQRSSAGVTADALPTVQLDNGVAWSQAVSGNTVFVGGNFSNARPAGAAAGTNLVPRSNLLAYDIRTGELISAFAPSVNAQVNAVTTSPDGSRLYVGGSFTQANGVNRYRIAAFDTATGALISSFAPSTDASVNSLYATATTLYVGGGFSQANGNPRTRLAAFSTSDGSLLGWAPTADNTVRTMVLSPDGSRLLIGGSFGTVNGTTTRGLAAVDAATGALLPLAANAVFQDYGANGAIMSLTTDGTSVFGTGYAWTSPSNFEGVFSIDPNSGAINWIADCHGDGYGVYPGADQVYVVSHEHDCSNSGGFPNYSAPESWYRTTAFTKNATGVTGHDSSVGYTDYSGRPSPSLVNWFPSLAAGTFTGQSQAAWTVTGNDNYVVEGGEFPKVNGVVQYGLVRFATKAKAPNKTGPVVPGTQTDPVVAAMSSTAARLSWQTNWDRDDRDLTYSVFRQDYSLTVPVQRRVIASQFWNRPTAAFLDTGLTPGQSYTYYLRVTDADGNVQRSNNVTVTMPTTGRELVSGRYSTAVQNDGASNYWRLDQTGGSTATDLVGGSDLTLNAGVGSGAAGVTADGDTASTFNGTTSGFAVTSNPIISPTTYSQELWFKTRSTSAALMSFGAATTGNSKRLDHYLGLTDGRVTSKLYTGTYQYAAATSSLRYNDGNYHQAAVTFSVTDGLSVYVDGALVARNQTVPSSGNYLGYWRVGGDTAYVNGTIDDVSVYPTVLTAAQVRSHFDAAKAQPAVAPSPSFSSSATGLTVALDASATTTSDGSIAGYAWDFGDGTTSRSTTATVSHDYAAAGTYAVKLTATGSNGAVASTTKQVTVSAPNRAPTASFTASCADLTCTFDGSASTDSDGSLASYAWDFGDGSSGVGAKPSHTYAGSGTYPVKLTVTDNAGAVGTLVQNSVVTAPNVPTAPTVLASDAFTRSVTNGWGSADTGGAWTVTGGSALFGVNGSAGTMTMNAAGAGPTAVLNSVSAKDVTQRATVSINNTPTGNGVSIVLLARRSSAGDYRLKLRLLPAGVVHLALSRVVAGTETVLQEVNVAALTYKSGDVLQVEFAVSGTTLTGKVWAAGAATPAGSVTTTDTTAALQTAGTVGIQSYLAGNSTVAPIVATFDDVQVSSPQGS